MPLPVAAAATALERVENRRLWPLAGAQALVLLALRMSVGVPG